jgi:alkylhydroperoxidase family enzyme
MARIPLIESENASPQVRAAYDTFAAVGTPLLNVIKLIGNHEEFLAGFTHIMQALYIEPRLSPRYRELAYLRASQLNSCHY